MQYDWFMYHLRSTYKDRLDFPFKVGRYNSQQSYAMWPRGRLNRSESSSDDEWTHSMMVNYEDDFLKT